jgi:hypothetical protein
VRVARAVCDLRQLGHQMRLVEHSIGVVPLSRVLREDRWLKDAANVLVYSRFFLHAVTQEVQDALLGDALELSGRFPTTLALEFRTPSDAALAKMFDSHFRRFVSSSEITAWAHSSGWSVVAVAEGQGLAPMGAEDPNLARVIATSDSPSGASR